MGQLAVCDPVTLADRGSACGVAGRRRLRHGHPPPHRPGAALDERSVYFLARLSPRYPTVEVRVADVCLDVGIAVLAAGLTRALVATALAEARRGTPVAAAPARFAAKVRRWCGRSVLEARPDSWELHRKEPLESNRPVTHQTKLVCSDP